NFCVASVLGSSCTTCTLRSCAPYAPINSSKYLCFERSLMKGRAVPCRAVPCRAVPCCAGWTSRRPSIRW
ncbi:MAG: hypothetical protein LBJ16_03325, partial [Holosporaceae bacterium]|nr:hypothetical protein [Holosporaceae bacterium]